MVEASLQCVTFPSVRSNARWRWGIFALLSLWLTLAVTPAHAYSYAAAGKEPLIQGREALLKAAEQHDTATMNKTLASLHDELSYLESHHNVVLIKPLQQAVAAGDATQIDRLMARAFKAEIERRLEGARANLKDYQTAKVLVVKSKHFLDLLQPALDKAQWDAAEQALAQCLTSIGNPGVFGVGAKAPDPAAFDAAEKQVMQALKAL